MPEYNDKDYNIVPSVLTVSPDYMKNVTVNVPPEATVMINGIDYSKFDIKKQPYKCPICDGTGLVSRPPNIAGDQQTWTSTNSVYTCRACEKGILWK